MIKTHQSCSAVVSGFPKNPVLLPISNSYSDNSILLSQFLLLLIFHMFSVKLH